MGSGENTITAIIRSVDGPVAMRYHPSAGEVAIANHAGERTIVATMRYNAKGELGIEIEDEEGGESHPLGGHDRHRRQGPDRHQGHARSLVGQALG